MESILNSIKKLLGITTDYTVFDTDIILYINGVLMILNQLGVGPKEGYVITGADETWDDFLGEGKLLESVKPFVYLKVRLQFDPPTTSFAIDSFNKLSSEYEWRIYVMAGQQDDDNGGNNGGDDSEFMEALEDHINDPEPHPAYDEDIPSLKLIFENGLI